MTDSTRFLSDQRKAVLDASHLERQREFSERTFGPGSREEGVIDHIRKELTEIEDAGSQQDKLAEWVDVVILAFDGAWRCGAEPQEILDAILAKQARNEQRVWPDWRTAPAGKAIEHDRSHDMCGRVLVGQGGDTFDPTCVLPTGHGGLCKPTNLVNPSRLR